ncbi:His-Xaa-Ser system radical SAM maturase HxsC [Algoriphagus sp. 4150]|uniref:His-Xaa-Ser system radical SAM maturase HxsC n=1 Tax=Algoriphagus sp. 4150 TaxID=2817756 RepID=UPI00285AB8C7|nr:His-Xaa-Ser system radical SAM maturase HxsC [Algoriphagus sp. 4150]MDR7128020.1 His-Xaa-Ser system radical SAM maturase HxsC [Algoriphagus sp. 4150]
MIQLFTKGISGNIQEPVIARIGELHQNVGKLFLIRDYSDLGRIKQLDKSAILLFDSNLNEELRQDFSDYTQVNNLNTEHLSTGDIIRIGTKGEISTLFRENSQHNSLFITDRCNSNCIMCSQPPRNRDDLDHFWEINTRLVALIPKETQVLGITGGEPTLLGKRFVELLALLKMELPMTGVHVLTNGRSFAWKNFVEALSLVENQKVVFGIPLYSDYYATHDYIVQAKDAFDQTMLGLYNLERYNQRVEIRVVLHQQSFDRLPQLAKYIFRNLPFVEHIAFMGLEFVGYSITNRDLLWIEPEDYMGQLEEAVLFLDSMGMDVSIYNLPLCLLRPVLWRFSRNSISDWKRDYVEECQTCGVLEKCGGVFGTSKKLSNRIKSISR